MKEKNSEVAFLKAQIAELDVLLENTPESHFLMQEPLKARKKELMFKFESLETESDTAIPSKNLPVPASLNENHVLSKKISQEEEL